MDINRKTYKLMNNITLSEHNVNISGQVLIAVGSSHLQYVIQYNLVTLFV